VVECEAGSVEGQVGPEQGPVALAGEQHAAPNWQTVQGASKSAV